MPTFNDYRNFAKRVASKFTDTPVKLELDNLPHRRGYDVVARNYQRVFTPRDKTQETEVVRYGVILDKEYYDENRNNPQEIKQAIIHELAHQASENKIHTEKFKQTARKLGADRNHQNPYWK